MPTKKPILPFEGYKWQWATLQCTEGINDPPVFLGVLRAARAFEGKSPSDIDFNKELKKVEAATNTRISMARTADRNIIRNSGQYWKGLGLLRPAHGVLALTKFGRKIADGLITRSQFAAIVIRNLTLPNKIIQSNWQEWESSGIRIKPLMLILEILAELGARDKRQAYVTPYELFRIVIPLSGTKNLTTEIYADALMEYRNGVLSIEDWPNCVPGANDKRIAREFLLFLSNYGFITPSLNPDLPGDRFQKEIYHLEHLEPHEIKELSVGILDIDPEQIVQVEHEAEEVSSLVERRRVSTMILTRPGQARFRESILHAFGGRCLLTGNDMPTVLEAAHIRPVANHGNDRVANGLCLRSDIHQLFDSGHLRIDTTGKIHLSDSATRHNNYNLLPKNIDIPDFIARELIEWRWEYL